MRMRYPTQTREEVLKLIASGTTYAEIHESYGIPKSTLSYWSSSSGLTPDRTRQLTHLIKARACASVSIREKKQKRLELATKNAGTALEQIDLENIDTLKGLLAMLYWAEGSKSDRNSLIFVNTDPELLSLYVWLLRKAYSTDESKFRVRIHLHPYHDPVGATSFWSRTLEIPESQFGKIYVKKRSTQKKFRQNFQGICWVIYHDSSIRRELLALGRLLAEKTCSRRSMDRTRPCGGRNDGSIPSESTK